MVPKKKRAAPKKKVPPKGIKSTPAPRKKRNPVPVSTVIKQTTSEVINPGVPQSPRWRLDLIDVIQNIYTGFCFYAGAFVGIFSEHAFDMYSGKPFDYKSGEWIGLLIGVSVLSIFDLLGRAFKDHTKLQKTKEKEVVQTFEVKEDK